MKTTLPTGTEARDAGLDISPTNETRWGSGSRHPVAAYVATHLLRDVGAHTVEKMIYGRTAVNGRCAAIIRGFHALRDQAGLVRFTEPIDAAIACIEALPFDRALVERVAEADCQDNVARELLLECRTREHALAAIRRSQATRAALLQFELSVASRWQICL